jgi:hypothetical protein
MGVLHIILKVGQCIYNVLLLLYKIKTFRFSFQPIKSEQAYEGDDKWKIVSYEKTPIMSTYLLAYIVGEFDYVEGTL